MPEHPFDHFIQRYFPSDQWENAACISLAEVPTDAPGYPDVVRSVGPIECAGVAVEDAQAYGIFGILDVCYDPAISLTSPFPQHYWDRVLDPNVNTWMAALIWSINGWEAWTTCASCNVCDVDGTIVPHPRHPVEEGLNPIVVGAGVAVLGGLLVAAARRR